MSEGMKAAARGLAVMVGFIAVIAIAILITGNHDSSTSADSSDTSDLQSQLDDATACIHDASSFINDTQGSIEDAKNVAWASYDEMGSALDELDPGSPPSCLDNY